MRKLTCYPSAVGSTIVSTHSQQSIRDLFMREKQAGLTTISTNLSTSHGIIDYFLDKLRRSAIYNINGQTFDRRRAIIRSHPRWRKCRDFMLRFAHTFKTLPSFYANIGDKCTNLLVISRNTVVSPNSATTKYFSRRSLASVKVRLKILDPDRIKTLELLSAPMSSIARNKSNDGNNKYKPREITFKTPYGHIACLEWGQREAPNKILCAHGWLDNAGSFEPLIPFILKHENNYSKYHVVAMDMPGVGHSSHRPPGSEYTIFSHIIEMRRVTQQLGWHQNLTLLAHSMGGHLSFIYSCIYPKQVSSMISIDTTHPLTNQAANWHVNIGNSIEHYFKCENYGLQNDKLDTVVPVYTEAGAIKRLMDAHNNSLTLESAKVMFKRGATKHPNGSCTFNRDVRHRHLSVEFRPDDELMLKFLEHTFRPDNVLIIRALRSPYHRPDEMRLRYYSLFERNCRLFRDVMLDGTHHLHMNTPGLVAIEINRFLEDAEVARTKASEGCEDDGPPRRPFIGKPKL